MTRNLILFMVVAAVMGPGPVWLEGPQGIARGQSSTTIDVAMDAPAPPIVQDNFDDNQKWKLWKLFQEDPNRCTVAETNKRLEFTATGDPNETFAGYLADSWWIDPSEGFGMKLDLYYDLVTDYGGWVVFGLTPNPEKPRDQYVSLGIGCASRYPSFWREWKDGYEMYWDFAGRPWQRVTVYISYDPSTDELYVSDLGYGMEDAWQVVPEIVSGRWGRKPLFVFIGGIGEGAKVDSGHAYADNFLIEQGKVIKPLPPAEPNEPNEPSEPNEPNLPPTGPGGFLQPEVPATVMIMPATIERQRTKDPITAVATLPKGITTQHVALKEPLFLLPGGLEAMEQTAFAWFNGKVLVIGSFNTARLLEVTPNNGVTTLQFVGRLKDGRYFGGTDTVTINK